MPTIKKSIASIAFVAGLILSSWIVATAQTASPSPAAAPPASDIFIVDVTSRNGKMKLGLPVKITSWVGYNNQPSFTADGQSILYTSIKDKQADIYRYDIARGTTTQITK